MNFLFELNDESVLWTARLALVCYLLRGWFDFQAYRWNAPGSSAQLGRILWTAGALFFLGHIYSAFSVVHGMSHTAAYEHTAQRTADVIGIHWGGGIYVNHAFTILWVIDVLCWWWNGLEWGYRSRLYYWTIQGIFAFMFLNATLIFGPRYWTWVLLCIAVMFTVLSVSAEALRKQELPEVKESTKR